MRGRDQRCPSSKEFQECYDIRKAPLTQEYLDLYKRLKEETAGLGIEFPY
ncbi:MAG TPA: monomethylamine:corrinoid methyltransferase [Chloroflexi bacterium]|nr:monomethylamine:corrinoid methyltransferase [Chloroflexota bacterium]